MRQGGVTGRPGTLYVGKALNGGNAVRLIPFIFNETGLGQSYVLEFGNQYIAFYQNGGNIVSSTKTITNITQANPAFVTSAAHGFSNGDIVTIETVIGMTQVNNAYFIIANVSTNAFSLKDLFGNAVNSTTYGAYVSGGTVSKIYIVPSPYAQADLATLNFAQSADVLTIVHPSYAPRELSRAGATSWSLANVVFGPSLFTGGVNTLIPAGGGAGTQTYSWMVTMVLANGDETNFSSAITQALININQPSPSNPVSITWHNANPEPAYYRIYRANVAGGVFSAYGYIGISPAGTRSFVDTITSPDFTETPPITSPFESLMGAGYYPSVVGFTQQRRVFSAWNNNPIGVAESKPGSFSNFDVHTGTTPDDDPIFYSIAGEEVNAITNVLELKFMLILTAGAEIYVQGNGSGVVTPSAINASTQSQYGCAPLRALKIGDILLFNQALGSFIRDFSFDFAIDGYRGNDISVFSSHLFEGYQIVDWAYQKTPDSIIWVVRSDGTLLSCTYVREQQVLAWARHDFTGGTVENICAIPENGEYAIYLSIKRVVNGQTFRYIEKISSRLWSDPINATYLDSYLGYNGMSTNASPAMQLSPPVGGFLTGSTAYQQQIILSASAPYFTAAMVGDQIFLNDALFLSSKGTKGNQVRLDIQAYTSTTQVTVTPSMAVPADLQTSQAAGTWSRAIATISGLSHLEGSEVSIWADRFVVGSPLNSQVSTVYTVTNGIVILDKPYAIIYVGLPMIQDVETLDLEAYFGETMLAKRKRVSTLAAYLYNTRSFFCGGENPDRNLNNTDSNPLFELYEEKDGTGMTTYDEPPPLLTEQDYVIVPSRWNKSGRLFIRNVDPVPFSLLALSPRAEDSLPNSTYKRV